MALPYAVAVRACLEPDRDADAARYGMNRTLSVLFAKYTRHMAKPTTRVLTVLDLLQTHGRMSGPELARRIGVSGRTLRRYIVALEDLGIPLTTERGPHGAYMLVAGFKLPPMMFTNDEAVALSVGMVAARGLGLAEAAPAVESAQAKLTRVMPDGVKRHVRAIADTVRIDLRSSAQLAGGNEALIVLTAAARAQERVHLDYRSAQGQSTERDFDPYGLAWRAGVWYAMGWCHLRRAVRSFRLDRIGQVAAIGEPFERPAGFDALEHLERSIAVMPRAHAVEVLLRTDMDAAQRAFAAGFGLLEPVAGGVLLRSGADDLDWFAGRLAGLSFDFVIHAPRALRSALRRQARRLQRLADAD